MGHKTHRNALPEGYTLHWYRIDSILGQGAFGITYLAEDVNLHRKVAIKEYLPVELSVREGDHSVHPVSEGHAEEFRFGLERFIAEGRTLDKFEHPNIVRVVNVFEANSTAYMVMAYEHGESLKQVLRRRSLGEAELMKILIPILDGLEKIHAQGFIHRDIKPDNIYIREDGSPVLLDFGAARQSLQEKTRTLTNFVSPGYAPIEQYASKSDKQGPWSDIYGLGATLYKAVVGRAPPPAVDRSEALLHDSRDMLLPTLEIARDRFSVGFLQAVDHALQFRAQDRPQSVAEWREEFEGPTEPAPRQVHDFSPTLKMPAAGDEENRSATAPTVVAGAEDSASVATTTRGSWTRRAGSVLGLGLVAAVLGLGLYIVWPWLAPPPAAPSLPAWDVDFGDGAVAPPLSFDLDAALQPPAEDAEAALEADLGQWSPLAPAQPEDTRVAELLAAAEADLAALRLTTPPGANALERYQQVLELEPGNDAARRGLLAIVDRYSDLARLALDAGEWDRAERFISRGMTLAPEHPGLLEARDALAAARAAPPPAAAAPETPAQEEQQAADWRQRLDEFLKRSAEAAAGREPADSRGEDFRRRVGSGR